MSWLNISGNISSITNNISSFTREVLTEAGTEAQDRFEDEDQDYQLHDAQYQIRNLENKIHAQRTEIERVNKLNEELQEQVQSTEIQIQAISSQYKVIIQEKENEINQMKNDQFNNPSSKVNTEEKGMRNRDNSMSQDEYEDTFILQMKLDKLTSENKALLEETAHWKEKSLKKEDSSSFELQSLREAQQHEIASLQSTHSQRMSSLKKRHKDKVKSLEEQIERLSVSHEKTEVDESITESKSTELRGELNQLVLELQNKENTIMALKEELGTLQKKQDSPVNVDADSEKLLKHNKNLQLHLQNTTEELDALREELNTKEMSITNLKKQIDEQDSCGTVDNVRLNQLINDNEQLSNDLQMKEIVITSIERQVQESDDSFKDFVITDFDSWMSHCSANLSSSCKEGVETTQTNMEFETLQGKFNTQSENSIHSMNSNDVEIKLGLIGVVEEHIRQFDEADQYFIIEEFPKWFSKMSVNFKTMSDQLAIKGELLHSIEEEIRDFDDEYIDFQASEFSSWFEKLQNKIDDLAEDLLNEQEVRSNAERLQLEERMKLNDIFMEKQQEITDLKVEMFKLKSNVEVCTDPSNEPPEMDDHEGYMSMQEKLTEAIARCEALSTEIGAVASERDDYKEKLENVLQKNSSILQERDTYLNEINSLIELLESIKLTFESIKTCDNKQSSDVRNFNLPAIPSHCYLTQAAVGKHLASLRDLFSELSSSGQSMNQGSSLDIASNALSEEYDHTNSTSYESAPMDISDSVSKDMEQKDLPPKVQSLSENEMILHCQSEGSSETLDDLIKQLKTTVEQLDKRKLVLQVFCECFQDLYKQIHDMRQNDVHNINLSKCNEALDSASTDTLDELINLIKTSCSAISNVINILDSDAERWKQHYEKLYTDHSSQESTVETLRSSFIEITAEKTTLQESVDMLRQDYKTAYQNYQDALNENQILQEELDKLQFHLDENETDDSKEITELKMQLSELKTERESFLKMVSERDESILEQQAQFDSETDELLRKRDVDINQLQEQIEQTQDVLISKTELNKQLEARIVELNSQVENLNVELRSAQESKENVSIAKFEDSETSANETDQLCQLLRDKETEYQALEKRLNNLTQDNSELFDLDMLQQETSQLKTLLLEKDQESQRLRSSLMEAQNENSDMILVQQESHQLKEFLNELGQKYAAKEKDFQMAQSQLVELQNQNSDMMLLHEECKQLKTMLLEKEKEMMQLRNSKQDGGLSVENSSVDGDLVLLQEENRHMKNMFIEKENEYRELQSQMIDIKNRNSDMELLQEQCNQLKVMLLEKEQNRGTDNDHLLQEQCSQLKQMLLQKDKELEMLKSNKDTLHSGLSEDGTHNSDNEKYTAVVVQYNTLLQHYQQLQSMLDEKDNKCKELEQMIDQNDSQEENIHMLQTEYRQVEEKFTSKEKECIDLRQQLFDAETHCERLSSYQDQFQQLKEVLAQKESELSNLKLQSSESSILESETVTLLQKETNQLKAIVYERESEFSQLQIMFNNKTSELQELQQELVSKQSEISKLSDQNLKEKEAATSIKESDSKLLDAAERRIKDLEVVDKKNSNENEELRNKIKELEVTLHHSEDEVKRVNSDLDSLRQQLNINQSAFLSTEEEVTRCKDELNSANVMLEKAKQDGEQEIQKNKGLTRKLKEGKLKLEKALEDLKKKNDDFDDYCERLNTALANLDKEREVVNEKTASLIDLSRTLSETEATLKDLQEENNDLKMRCDEAMSINNELVETKCSLIQKEDEIKDLNVEITNKNSATEYLQKQLDDKSKELKLEVDKFEKLQLLFKTKDEDHLQTNETSHQLEVTSLQDMLTEAKDQYSSKALEVDALESKVMQMKEEMNDTNNKRRKLEESKTQLELSIAGKDTTIMNIEAKLNDQELKYKEEIGILKKDLSKKEKIVSKMNAALKKTKVELQSKVEELGRLQTKFENLSEEISMKENKIANLMLDLQSSQELIESKDDELKLSEAKISKIAIEKDNACKNKENELRTAQVEIERLSNELSTLEKKLEKLKDIEASYSATKEECEMLHKEVSLLKSQVKPTDSDDADLLRDALEKNSKLFLEKNKECDKLKMEIITMEGELHQNRLSVDAENSLKSRIDELETALDERQKRLEKLEEEYEKQLSSNDQINANYIQLKAKFDMSCRNEKDTKDSMEMLQQDKMTLQNKLLEIQNEHMGTKTNLDNVTQKFAALKMTLAEKDAKIDELEGQQKQLSYSESNQNISDDNKVMNTKERTIAVAAAPLALMPHSRDATESSSNHIIEKIHEKEKELGNEIAELKKLNQAQEVVIQQLQARVKELEVILRHKEINCKEIEVKTARDLERLRNHLISNEERHTADVLEMQERERRLEEELVEVKKQLHQKSNTLQSSSDQFHSHMSDLEEQLNVLSIQRDQLALELSKRKEHMEHNSIGMRNLQLALEQLQREKEEQYEYLTEKSRRELKEANNKIDELQDRESQTQTRIQEANLAVQGVAKLSTDVQQKEEQMKMYKEKVATLSKLLQEREQQVRRFVEASDTKLDRALMKNLLSSYFQSPESKRADIIKVIGGLLGLSMEDIRKIGTGAPPKVNGWLTNVFGAPEPPSSPSKKAFREELVKNVNQSFSELFVSFLQNETDTNNAINTASLSVNELTPDMPNIMMLSPSTQANQSFFPKQSSAPSIQPLFAKQPFSTSPTASSEHSLRIPAPGQEIPRVHTKQANSTLKSLLAT